MPRSVATSIENNFTKGLITEVTGANSPENSVTDTIDITYDRTGRARTRKGLDFEDSYVWSSNPDTDGVYNEYLWETTSENSAINFIVVQTGRYVNFYKIVDGASLSSQKESFVLDLNSYKTPETTTAQVQANYVSFASGRGYLFLAAPTVEPLYVSYDSSTDVFSVTKVTIEIRDFEGVDDGLAVDTRPTTDSDAHRYNAYNQGWYTGAKINGGQTPNVYDYWFSQQNDYPSNVDFWWYYTAPDTAGSNTGLQNFDPSDNTVQANTGLLGNTPAPKGHYILSALATNRSALSGLTVNEKSSNGYRPSCVAFYASRAFYAGVGAKGYTNTVYFTQIIESDDKIGKCYQSNDPTSKDYFDLLATDGGVVEIQDINNVIDMRVIGQSLYLFASNGVWSISGTLDSPFKATDYTVTKVSSFPALSRLSIVDLGGLPVWWNYEGIYALQSSGGAPQINNLSNTTIQRFYNSIPAVAKKNCKGRYSEQDNLVYWIYNSDGSGSQVCDRVLVFDTLTNAFYVYSLPTSTNQIVGISSLNVSGVRVFKFTTISSSGLTFTEFNKDVPIDYPGTLNSNVSAFFITGYRIRGDLLNKFQTNYLTVITEPHDTMPSCYIQGLWDYANNDLTGRFTNPQQVYRYNGYRNYERSKLKIRGNGRSLQFKFFNDAGSPFTVVAWAAYETSNQAP